MARLKLYTLGTSGFIGVDVATAIGEPTYRRQATVLVAAASKAEAVRVAAEASGVHVPSLSDPEFRVTDRPSAGSLLAHAAGRPAVYVHALMGGHDCPVVRVGADGPRRVGRLVRADGFAVTFEAEGD